MNKSDFEAFVKRQQNTEQEEPPFDPKQQLQEWLDYLHVLYGQIEEYLTTYKQAGAVQIEYRDIRLNEEFSGDYTAREMILKIGRSTVTFRPIGTMLIGSKGRVDVEGPLGKARLVLINKKVTSARQLIQVTVTVAGHPPPAPPSREAIKNIEWTWKISTPPPAMTFIDLTQETFFDMILAVANG